MLLNMHVLAGSVPDFVMPVRVVRGGLRRRLTEPCSRASRWRDNRQLASLANRLHPGADYVVAQHGSGTIVLRDRRFQGVAGVEEVRATAMECCRQRAWTGCSKIAARDVLNRKVPWRCVEVTWEWLKGPSQLALGIIFHLSFQLKYFPTTPRSQGVMTLTKVRCQ